MTDSHGEATSGAAKDKTKEVPGTLPGEDKVSAKAKSGTLKVASSASPLRLNDSTSDLQSGLISSIHRAVR